jgi:TfoX/Sxy family transcriptional regulator of competence genes
MKFEKPGQAIIDFFEAVAPDERGIEKRKMFGCPCRFAGGNMFMGVYINYIILRLSEKDRKSFLQLPGARLFEPMAGRVMKEYVTVPQSMHASRELETWIERSLAYVKSLPPKKRAKSRVKKK